MSSIIGATRGLRVSALLVLLASSCASDVAAQEAARADAGARAILPQFAPTAASRRPFALQGEFQGNVAGGAFGISLAVADDTAIVGAPGGGPGSAGTAIVYVRRGKTWTPQQTLLPADSAGYDLFGWSIALERDTAVISAPFAGGAGAVYVFTRTGSTWTQRARLTPSDDLAVDEFGWAVALDGDTIAASSPTRNHYAGAVYIFTSTPSGWSQQALLGAADSAENDGFGQQVALRGDIALVGAPWKQLGTGAAYAFVRDRLRGTWSEAQKLTAADGASNDAFGSALSLDGGTALIGAPGKAGFTGAVYAFVRGATWSEQQELLPPAGTQPGQFGSSIAVQDDLAVIAAPNAATYVFARTRGAWSLRQQLVAADGAFDDAFGRSVGLSGTTACVGAPQKNSDTGTVYVFTPPSFFP